MAEEEKRIHYLRMARMYEEDIVNPEYQRFIPPLYKRIMEAEKRRTLYHYTNVDALFKILSNRSLRFSRIDCVNDLSEKDVLNVADFFRRTFVSCFCNDPKESIPLWHMYTPRAMGVRIEFNFLERDISNSIVELTTKIPNRNDINIDSFFRWVCDIDYRDGHNPNPVEETNNKDIHVAVEVIGSEKSTAWDYENETRIIALFRGDSCDSLPEHLDFRVDFSKIEQIKVVCDPWMSDEVKKSIELTTQYYLKEYKDIIKIDDSELKGKIRRNY